MIYKQRNQIDCTRIDVLKWDSKFWGPIWKTPLWKSSVRFPVFPPYGTLFLGRVFFIMSVAKRVGSGRFMALCARQQTRSQRTIRRATRQNIVCLPASTTIGKRVNAGSTLSQTYFVPRRGRRSMTVITRLVYQIRCDILTEISVQEINRSPKTRAGDKKNVIVTLGYIFVKTGQTISV